MLCLKGSNVTVGLTKHNFEDIMLRFDVVSLLVVSKGRALLRHHLNALGTL